MATYQKNKPLGPDKLKNSQGDLLGNFQALNDAFEVNHDISTFTSPAEGDEGKHKYVAFVQQSGDPASAPIATEKQFYTKDAGGGLGPHFFIRNNGGLWDVSKSTIGGAGDVSTIEMNLFAEFSAAVPLVFKTGQTINTKIAASSETTITYPVPFTTATIHVVVTPFINSNVDINLHVKSIAPGGDAKVGFIVFNPSSTACDLFFFAIGR